MPSLSLFDNRTLLASNFIVAAVFAVIFFGVTRVFPYVRGMRSIALSYLLVMPACVLLGAQREIPYFVSVIPANLLLMLAIYAMCDGIAQFCDSPRRTKRMAGLIVVGLAAITWFTVVKDSLTIRIVLLALATAVMRSVAAYNLLVRSSVSVNRKVMQLFSLFLALLAVSGLFRALHLVWQGSPRTFLEQSTSVTFMLGLALIYLSFSGCCFLLLASSELIISSRLASERDVVTGVLNRRGLEDRLQVEMDLMEANGQALTVCLLDVDLFKPINDMLGHNAGDEALGSLAQAILKSVRGRDHIGRYGGDEFLVVLPQTSAKEVHVVIDRLRNAISALPVVGGKHKLSVSLGFAEARTGETRSMLIARADAALYLEKSKGRGNRRNRTEDRLESETSEIASGVA